MYASSNGRESVVRLLLEHGARLEPQDNSGSTAQHLAVDGNHAVVLEALCSAQGAAAALALRNSAGRTPLTMAISIGRARARACPRAQLADLMR